MSQSIEELQTPLNLGENRDTSPKRAKNLFLWVQALKAETLLSVTRYLNIVLSCFQGIAGFMGLFDLMSLSFTRFFISLYVILFSLILLSFECRFSTTESILRRNFGFIFSNLGRILFICFSGLVDFGIKDKMAILIGLFMLINAFISTLIFLWHSNLKQPQMDPRSTKAGYKSASQV